MPAQDSSLREQFHTPTDLYLRDASPEELAKALQQAQAALSDFRAILGSTGVGLCLLQDGVFQYVNPAFVELFGYEAREQLEGRSPQFLIHPSEVPNMLEFMTAAIEGGARQGRFTFRGLRADESEVMCEARARVTELGGQWVIVGTVIDVTARTAAEAERDQLLIEAEQALEQTRRLAETEQALRDTVGSVGESLDLDQVLDRILESVGRVVPHDTADIMLLEAAGGKQELRPVRGRGYRERGIEDWLLQLRLPWEELENFVRMEQTGQPVAVPDVSQASGWMPLAETAWVASYAGAPLRHKGRTIGFLNLCSEQAGAYRQEHAETLQAFANQAAVAIENARLFSAAQEELTERKRAEQALRTSENRYRSVFEGVQDAIIVERLEGGILEVNSSACQLFGWDREAVLGESLSGLLPELEPMVRVARTEPKLLPNQPIEFDVESIPGRDFPIELRLQSYALDDQQVLLAVGRDISDRKLVEETRREAARMKMQFILSASHSLRTPLHTLMGFLELLTTGKVTSQERQADFLRRAADDAGRIYELIGVLMDAASLEAGEQDLTMGSVRLRRLINQLVSARLPEAAAAGVDLVHARSSQEIVIQADRRRLGAAIDEVMNNAIRYSPSGCEVRVQARQLDGRVEIEISDQGPGIPASDLQALQGESDGPQAAQARLRRTSSGPGLGLYLANSIMQAHGGELAISSSVGEGTTVLLRLPA